MRNVLFFIIGIVIISGAVWIFAARNKKTEPVDAPRPMRPAAVQQTTPAPQPKPEPPPKPVEEPAPVPDICILPGTIYELHLPPLPREGTSPQILMNDGARVQILFKQKILQIQRQYAEVPRRIAADIPRIGQLYEAVECLWSAMHDCKRTFAFTPLTETAYRVRTLRSPMPREEYDKIHQEEYKSVLETLKRYSPKEQAQFLYFAASREEQYLGSVLFREALPDTEANRKILERDYRAWVATHAWMLKKREELLAFY